MSASTWAPARQMTGDPADGRPAVARPMVGRATAASRRRRGGLAARERFSSARRPVLRLVPPLPESAGWPADTIPTPHRGTASAAAAQAVHATELLHDGDDARGAGDTRHDADAALLGVSASTPAIPRESIHARPLVSVRPAGSASSPARPRSAHPPIRLTRRGRGVLAGLLLIFAAVIVAVLATNVQAAAPSSPPRAIVVHPGDTLWSIAARVHPRGSLTDTMLTIERLNHMADGTVYVGQQLLVPNS